MEFVRSLNFGELVVDETGLFARRGDETIQFTRNERALLLAFFRNPRRLMSRSRLLDEIASPDSEASDRNIDFLVNRLRSKLGDSARLPRYIATQYGEGYVWVAAPATVVAQEEYLLISTTAVREELRAQASSIAHGIRDRIAASIDAGQGVVVGADGRQAETTTARYLLSLNLEADDPQFHCSATLREMPSKRIVRAFRLDCDRMDDAMLSGEVVRVANGVIGALRQALADASTGLGNALDQPLLIRLRKASTLLSSSNPKWLQRGARLSEERRSDPSNADIALQWCLHLFARLVIDDPFSAMHEQGREEIENEIETTVLSFLPAVESNPLLMLAAAKLLYFVNRGHLELAEDLAERAILRTADLAAALPVIGQLRQARGNYREAIACFDRGIGMADADPEFLLHMRVLKCIALLAAGDRAGLEAALDFSYVSPHCPPEISLTISLTFTPVDEHLPPVVAQALAAAGPEGASRAIAFVFHTSARHMTTQAARANILGRLIGHATRRHGEGVIPDFVRRSAGLASA